MPSEAGRCAKKESSKEAGLSPAFPSSVAALFPSLALVSQASDPETKGLLSVGGLETNQVLP